MKRATLIICLLLICTILLTVFASCKKNDLEYEDFKYRIHYEENNNYVRIVDLTEQGKQKEVLIIPTTIEGIPVKFIEKPHWSLFGETSTIWQSTKLKKVFIPSNINIAECTFDGCSQLKQIFIILGNDDKAVFNTVTFTRMRVDADVLVPKDYYNLNSRFTIIKPANINYYFNYKNSDNDGVYWIDNVEQGERILDIPPTEPTRKGWTFGGWYTEPECINKWEFTNTVPENGVDLYAKWL